MPCCPTPVKVNFDLYYRHLISDPSTVNHPEYLPIPLDSPRQRIILRVPRDAPFSRRPLYPLNVISIVPSDLPPLPGPDGPSSREPVTARCLPRPGYFPPPPNHPLTYRNFRVIHGVHFRSCMHVDLLSREKFNYRFRSSDAKRSLREEFRELRGESMLIWLEARDQERVNMITEVGEEDECAEEDADENNDSDYVEKKV
ncbi:hypothetical protein ABW19_dt0207586 [Dactylella cylindrospora]|nr:hypothetical protein ABW19_dt0207586 [Dactylella cylindrospora]